MIGISIDDIVAADQKTLEAFLMIVDEQKKIEINHILSLKQTSDKQLNVKGWFLPEVGSSLKEGSEVVLMILDVQTRQGYRLEGRCLEIRNIAVMDGVALIEEEHHFPQSEWELKIEVDAVKELERR